MGKTIDISITIDIISKLRKIYEGKTFSDDLVIITELFQNTQRAKAKNVFIELGEGKLTFTDDGSGCKLVKNILTLDHSSWESCNEGFGIGLWSWLAVENVEGIEIKSHNWKANLSIKDIFEEGNLNATVEYLPEKLKGFKVTIYSNIFNSDSEEIVNRLISDGEMQLSNVYINDDFVTPKDLHSDIQGEYKRFFSNRLFEASFVPSNNWRGVPSYYERRRIDNFNPSGFMEGVIEIKKNSLTLQEPDRKNIINDNKKYEFNKRLEDCRRELYLDIVKSGDNNTIDLYSYEISNVLDVADYEKHILADDLILEVKEESRNIEEFNPISKTHSFNRLVDALKNINTNTQMSLIGNISDELEQKHIEKLLNNSSDDYKWVKTNVNIDEVDVNIDKQDEVTEELLDTSNNIIIAGISYKKINISDYKEMFEDKDEDITSSITVKSTNKSKKKDSLRNIIKKTSRKVWVKASEVEEYTDLIAKVEYYGVKVFIAKNVLHENVFISNNVSYITDIESGITKRNIISDIALKTKKEERFIELLQPICNYYYLPINTFKIGYLKLIIETSLDSKIINREVIENRKGSINIFGLTDGEFIVLDRRALGLQRFNLSGNNIGVNELKALMAALKTISHELAHLLYRTEDNTKEHKERENQIYDELVNLYLTI